MRRAFVSMALMAVGCAPLEVSSGFDAGNSVGNVVVRHYYGVVQPGCSGPNGALPTNDSTCPKCSTSPNAPNPEFNAPCVKPEVFCEYSEEFGGPVSFFGAACRCSAKDDGGYGWTCYF